MILWSPFPFFPEMTFFPFLFFFTYIAPFTTDRHTFLFRCWWQWRTSGVFVIVVYSWHFAQFTFWDFLKANRHTEREKKWAKSLQQQFKGLSWQISMWNTIEKKTKHTHGECVHLIYITAFFPCFATEKKMGKRAPAESEVYVFILQSHRLTGLSWHNKES